MTIPRKVSFSHAEFNREQGILYVLRKCATCKITVLCKFKTVVHKLVPSIGPDNVQKQNITILVYERSIYC